MSYKEKCIYAFTSIVTARKTLAQVAWDLDVSTDEALAMHQRLLKLYVENIESTQFPASLVSDC